MDSPYCKKVKYIFFMYSFYIRTILETRGLFLLKISKQIQNKSQPRRKNKVLNFQIKNKYLQIMWTKQQQVLHN